MWRKVKNLSFIYDEYGKRDCFQNFTIRKIPHNLKADQLARASSGINDTTLPSHVVTKTLETPAIELEVSKGEGGRVPKWAHEITRFLTTRELPSEKEKARKVKNKATQFILLEGKLYKREFSCSLLRCISPEETQYIMKEIHEGICGNHSSRRTFGKKSDEGRLLMAQALKDAEQFVKKCAKCQIQAPIPHCPPKKLMSITSLWPYT
ncbi:hypothetical protein F2P56_022441 [Juglans regia]|uniref:Uncharacterized protein LOC108982459 n=2 Tax=Juglans regia TaxID=51240 RepID=A0A2I4DQG0_JUGRE|nr:uncharacterized protein LOC108982459 [Juglans regia]KAF5458414.1 hypothetical protein F2P56_022441 [Juglans regia]